MVIRVAVVGGGIVGFTSAVTLQEQVKGTDVTIITEKLTPETTSDVAAGVWEPMMVGDTPINKLTEWAEVTYNVYKKLWKDEAAAEMGLSMLPITCVKPRGPNTVTSTFYENTALGYTQLNEKQLQLISAEYDADYTWGYTYMTFSCMCSKMLPYLMRKFINEKGKIIQRRVASLEEVAREGYDIIVNCTGIGARELMGDTALTPIRGQIIRVRAPWQFDALITDVNEKYIIPTQDNVVLGGTYQQGDWNKSVSVADKQRISEGCKKFIPGLQHAVEVKNQVGLRPFRSSGVCVQQGPDINQAKVIHNYGHGGNGVTLSWGCAQEVANILNGILQLTPQPLHSKL